MHLKKKALRLSWFTVCYNIIEGAVSVTAGYLAGSVALVGFGLDSLVETISGGVMVWRFSAGLNATPEEEERIERRAEKFVGVSFFILAAYVLYEALEKLLRREAPEVSVAGFVITILSLFIMPMLYKAKYRTGKELGSRSLMADAKETLACAYLSAAVLAGLILNALLGWWWADPVAALIVVYFLVREGLEAIRGECCCGEEEEAAGEKDSCGCSGHCGGTAAKKRVTAAVLEKDGLILLARRKDSDALAGKWEFPGGKLEEGETPEACLARELAEEFGIVAEVGAYICSSEFEYNHFHVELLAYRAKHVSGDFVLNDHSAIEWVKPGDILSYDLASADIPVAKALLDNKAA